MSTPRVEGSRIRSRSRSEDEDSKRELRWNMHGRVPDRSEVENTLSKFQERECSIQSGKIQEVPSLCLNVEPGPFPVDCASELKMVFESSIIPQENSIESDEWRHKNDLHPLVKLEEGRLHEDEMLSMDLSRRSLRSIDVILGVKNLRVLNLSMNELVQLDGIGELVGLVELDVSHNLIEFIPESMATLGRLETLRLEGNKIASFDRLAALSALRRLSLDPNPTTMARTYRGDVISRMPMLLELDGKGIMENERKLSVSCCLQQNGNENDASSLKSPITALSLKVPDGGSAPRLSAQRASRIVMRRNDVAPKTPKPSHEKSTQTLKLENKALRSENQMMTELLSKNSLEMIKICDLLYEMKQELAFVDIDRQFNLSAVDSILKDQESSQTIDIASVRDAKKNNFGVVSPSKEDFSESPYIGRKVARRLNATPAQDTDLSALSKVNRAACRHRSLQVQIRRLTLKKLRIEKCLEVEARELDALRESDNLADEKVRQMKQRRVESLKAAIEGVEARLKEIDVDYQENQALILNLNPEMLKSCFDLSEMVRHLDFFLEDREACLDAYRRVFEENRRVLVDSGGVNVDELIDDNKLTAEDKLGLDSTASNLLYPPTDPRTISDDLGWLRLLPVADVPEVDVEDAIEVVGVERSGGQSGVLVCDVASANTGVGYSGSQGVDVARLRERLERLEAENALLREVGAVDLYDVLGDQSALRDCPDRHGRVRAIETSLEEMRRRKLETIVGHQIDFLWHACLSKIGVLLRLRGIDSSFLSREGWMGVDGARHFFQRASVKLKLLSVAFGGDEVSSPNVTNKVVVNDGDKQGCCHLEAVESKNEQTSSTIDRPVNGHSPGNRLVEEEGLSEGNLNDGDDSMTLSYFSQRRCLLF